MYTNMAIPSGLGGIINDVISEVIGRAWVMNYNLSKQECDFLKKNYGHMTTQQSYKAKILIAESNKPLFRMFSWKKTFEECGWISDYDFVTKGPWKIYMEKKSGIELGSPVVKYGSLFATNGTFVEPFMNFKEKYSDFVYFRGKAPEVDENGREVGVSEESTPKTPSSEIVERFSSPRVSIMSVEIGEMNFEHEKVGSDESFGTDAHFKKVMNAFYDKRKDVLGSEAL
jgi:hypothetical protein